MHQLLGIDRSAQGPDGPGEPLLQRGLLARSDQRLDRADLLLQGLRDLGTDQMAQGIGGEIAEQALKSVPTDLQVA